MFRYIVILKLLIVVSGYSLYIDLLNVLLTSKYQVCCLIQNSGIMPKFAKVTTYTQGQSI